MLVINPKYEHLRGWLEQLPARFAQSGEVIYDARNQIRVIQGPDGKLYNVKRYCIPKWYNRIAYVFRSPKAVRAYQNALILQQKEIATPYPIAYILCGRFLIKESYLITEQSVLTHTFYDFRDGTIVEKEDLIRAFAHFSAFLHNQGVLHLDYSPGNILYDYMDGTWQFQLVDINRLRFGSVSAKQGCSNLCRLWGRSDFFEVLAPVYASDRCIDAHKCLVWIQEQRQKFWKHHVHDHFVTDDTFSVGVIVSTYNNPLWLEKVLIGLSHQCHPAQEILIADDGSDERTRQLIEIWQHKLPIRHIWHEDDGFRKTTILNKAVMAATSEYLIFIDQDLIPRRDFIQQHYLHARKEHFVSGGAVLLPQALSEQITAEDIISGDIFRISWLKKHGMPWNWKMSKLCTNRLFCSIMNAITPTKATWNGGNASTWRQNILDVKGFDIRMRYGAEDREFGQRLENMGMRGIQLRYGLPLMHLWHKRPYRNEQDWNANFAIWQDTKRNHVVQTQYGIQA